MEPDEFDAFYTASFARLVGQNDPTGRVHAKLEELGCYVALPHEEVARL